MTRPLICMCTRFSTGGAEIDAVVLARLLTERGYRAEAWFLYRAGDLHTGEVTARVVASKVPRGITGLLSLVIAFVRLVLKERPAAIIGFQPLANILGSLATLFVGSRFLATQRGPAHSQTRLIAFIEGLLGSTPLYSGNVAITEAVARSYSNYTRSYRSKLKVVHLGVPLPARQTKDRSACRARFGLPEQSFLAGNVGRLHEHKNPHFLIDLAAQEPDLHLVLAGDGPEEASLRAEITRRGLTERVTLIGRIENSDVETFLGALDLFLLPSILEGFGRTLIEAFHAGVPVVANDLDTTREVCGDAAVLVPLSVSEWGETIRHLRANPQQRERLVSAGRGRIALFSYERMVDEHLRLLQLPERASAGLPSLAPL